METKMAYEYKMTRTHSCTYKRYTDTVTHTSSEKYTPNTQSVNIVIELEIVMISQ